ncbi:flagellar hook-associated protein 3 FlgL [Natronobacillus azotifigens]|uniref:Flagellar hook-associated protein FlgL n=1 Tax=Natronobacillus azotifigens TaxID=472978 RepID=A0A9J6R921_9BACI|nr:flagellar hook-associated protein FlgL [Natronobacillus azotifigens]MCZ0702117.1 flagellar hook-associated protein FlgL [Natronobacillus azotifigens]
MRISQSMLSNNMLRNVSNSYGNLNKYMNQLSTGKKITRPSEDPVVAMKGMSYRSQVSNVEQYRRNIGEVHNWLDNSDDALHETTQVLHRLNELAVQASNGTYENTERESIAKEVDQLIENLAEVGNTKVNNKFIFNGTNTNGTLDPEGNPMYPITKNDDGTYTVSDNENDVFVEVSAGTRLKVNTNPTAVFSQDLFDDLQAFAAALRDEDIPDAELSQHIEVIQGHTNQVVNERADIGARMNRIELIENRLASQEVTAKDMMSNNEDAELEEIIINLTTQEAIHRASLSAGARILQPTLLDFLR